MFYESINKSWTRKLKRKCHLPLLICESASHFQLFLTPWTLAHQAPLSMARRLEWVTIPFSKGSSQPRDWTCISCVSYITGWFFTTWATIWGSILWKVQFFFSVLRNSFQYVQVHKVLHFLKLFCICLWLVLMDSLWLCSLNLSRSSER